MRVWPSRWGSLGMSVVLLAHPALLYARRVGNEQFWHTRFPDFSLISPWFPSKMTSYVVKAGGASVQFSSFWFDNPGNAASPINRRFSCRSWAPLMGDGDDIIRVGLISELDFKEICFDFSWFQLDFNLISPRGVRDFFHCWPLVYAPLL